MAPDATPTAPPASHNRVGASPFIAHMTATKTGTDSVAIRKGQEAHVLPNSRLSRPAGFVPANATTPSVQIRRSGAARAGPTALRLKPGRERRERASRLATARQRT